MMELFITSQGLIRALYGEAIPFQVLGNMHIQRASYVEPDAAGNSQADLSPSGGPVLGPFPSRSAALHAEQDWLTEHVLSGNSDHLPEMSSIHDQIPSPEIAANSVRSAADAVQASANCSDLS